MSSVNNDKSIDKEKELKEDEKNEKVEEKDEEKPELYVEEGRLLTKETVVRFVILKLFEHLSKYFTWCINKYMFDKHIKIEYAISVRFNEYEYPCLMVEILNAELVKRLDHKYLRALRKRIEEKGF